ncbi:MAG: hypothetical protein RLZZ395_2547 [Pseudomonadota bacterium]
MRTTPDIEATNSIMCRGHHISQLPSKPKAVT